MSNIIDFETAKWNRYKTPQGVKTEGFNACMAPDETCANLESYGAKCVLCNMCGRFEEKEE